MPKIPRPVGKSCSIADIKPGDYVKYDDNLFEINDIFGISARGRLARPSEGGFWVVLLDGTKIDMFEAQAYYRKEDVCV